MDKKSYNTKNRSMIINFLKQESTASVSVQDIMTYLEGQNVRVNRSTVYRYLGQLCDDNKVIKYADQEAGKTLFQYIHKHEDCHEHLHMKCVSCQHIKHLDGEFMAEIKKHLEKDNLFSLQCEGSILYGICSDCKQLKDTGNQD